MMLFGSFYSHHTQVTQWQHPTNGRKKIVMGGELMYFIVVCKHKEYVMNTVNGRKKVATGVAFMHSTVQVNNKL